MVVNILKCSNNSTSRVKNERFNLDNKSAKIILGT